MQTMHQWKNDTVKDKLNAVKLLLITRKFIPEMTSFWSYCQNLWLAVGNV